jgi:hypothetical protein
LLGLGGGRGGEEQGEGEELGHRVVATSGYRTREMMVMS